MSTRRAFMAGFLISIAIVVPAPNALAGAASSSRKRRRALRRLGVSPYRNPTAEEIEERRRAYEAQKAREYAESYRWWKFWRWGE